MMPAADATAVVYSHLIDEVGGPRSQAHAAFEEALDAAPQVAKPVDEMTVPEQRELLRRQLQATGRDASQIREVAAT